MSGSGSGSGSGSSSLDDRIFEPRHIAGWLLFPMSAGIVNAGAVLATNTVVSHITGNVTTLALDASLAVALALIIASFIGGAMFSAFLTTHLARARLSNANAASIAFALSIGAATTLLLLTSALGNQSVFGAFGDVHETTTNKGTFIMLGLLAASMGMVNYAVASATQNKIRATHMTGPASDLAGNLVRAEHRWAALRFAMLLSFAVGAFVAARVGNTLRYDVFALAGVTLVTASALVRTMFGAAPSSATLISSHGRDRA